jgi:hypothetical protein
MQVNCYQRNFHTDVCSYKCPFRDKCERHYMKVLEERKNRDGGKRVSCVHRLSV